MKLIAAWQMNTTCSASAYESTAALRSSGESVGMMVVECLRVHMRAVSFSDIPAAEMRRRRLTECLRLSVVTTRTYGGWSVPLARTVHGANEGTHRNRVRPVYPLTELRSQDGLQERATQADANDLSGGPEEIRDCARKKKGRAEHGRSAKKKVGRRRTARGDGYVFAGDARDHRLAEMRVRRLRRRARDWEHLDVWEKTHD